MDQPSQTPENPSSSPATASERKGVLAFLSTLKKPSDTSDGTKPSDKSTGPVGPQSSLFRHFREYHWSAQQNIWLRTSLVVHIALVILIIFGGYLSFTRPTYIQIGAPTLSEAADDFFKLDAKDISFDHMAFFTISVLEQINKLDPNGNPYVSLLQGMVNPNIITRAEARFSKNSQKIIKQKLIQNLVVEQIYPPIVNDIDNSMAVFVRGYYSIMLADQNGDPVNRITQYRGKAIILNSPVSRLNPFPFYLESIQEVYGDEACKKWDEDNKKFFVK